MDSQSEELLAHIIRNTRIAALGTLRDEAPFVSMVTFIAAEDFSAFYLHVSRLAQHTMDMAKDKRVSLLIAEADDGRADPLTLARVSIRGSVDLLHNDEPAYTSVKNKYLEHFPESEPLFNLPGFEIWCIKPKGGRFVAGFGQAYNLTREALQEVSQLKT